MRQARLRTGVYRDQKVAACKKLHSKEKKLEAKFDAATADRENRTWGNKDVGDSMTAILREEDPAAAAPPTLAVQAQIGVLANRDGASLGVAKGKAKYRYDGEGSERSMLADIVSTQTICDPNGAPAGRAVPDDIPEGVRKSLGICSQAMGVPVSNLYFVDPHGLVGTDDWYQVFSRYDTHA